MSFGMSITEEKFLKALTGIAKNTGRIADALEAMNAPEVVEDCEIAAIPFEGRERAIEFLRKRKEKAEADERPRGHWTEEAACSECGGTPWYGGNILKYKFCPYCGADMRKDG